MRKIISIIALTMLSGIVLGQTKVGQLYFKITSNNTVSVVSELPEHPYYNEGNKPTGSVAIPQTVEIEGRTYTVKAIGESAFNGCQGLTSVVIPNSVTSIGGSAFNGCSGLTSINIPNSVTSIRYLVFYGCSSLTSIDIPNTVTSIGDYAFYNCSGLTNISIPNSVTSIGSEVFTNCSGLTNITVDAANATYTSQDGVLYNKDKTTLHTCPAGKAGEFVIPNTVTSIGDYAFYNCPGLTSISIPNSVTSIGTHAFSRCKGLTSINIPTSVTSIGSYAFYNCSGLREVTVNWATPLAIAANVFNETPINNATLYVPAGTAELYRQANEWKSFRVIADNPMVGETVKVGQLYYQITGENTASIVPEQSNYPYYNEGNKPMGSVTIPQTVEIEGRTYTVTSIGESAFYGCKGLTNVVIPGSVTSIGVRAFEFCKGLTSVVIPNTVTKIGNYAFDGCKGLTSINIPNSVTSIGYATFQGCWELIAVDIPGSVTSIGKRAFHDCQGLISVNIPGSVTSIGESAFTSCLSLTSINVDAANPAYSQQDGALYNKDKTTLHTCPAGKMGGFVIPNSVTSIGGAAFENCGGLTSIVIPNSVTNIGSSAFAGCDSLTSINIPNSVISIGDFAFSGCSELTSINIPNSVTSIGERVFWYCESLTSVNIPNSVTNIGEYAFSNCEGLREVTVNWATPLAVAENVFNKIPINNVTLSVPAGTAEQYRQADVWKNFGYIADATSSILSAKGNQDAITEIYNLRGERLSANSIDALPRGIYIVKKGSKAIKVVKP